MAWGDNGSARPTTKEYSDGFDRIFRRKHDTVATKKESAERGGDGKPTSEHAEPDRVGRSGSGDRNKNNGDDE